MPLTVSIIYAAMLSIVPVLLPCQLVIARVGNLRVLNNSEVTSSDCLIYMMVKISVVTVWSFFDPCLQKQNIAHAYSHGGPDETNTLAADPSR